MKIITLCTALLLTIHTHADHIHTAVINGDLSTVQTVLQDDIDTINSQWYSHKKTPLYIAAQCGFITIVAYLLKHGANPNLSCYYGTPLHAATEGGHLEVIHLLVTEKADINDQTNNNYETPLHRAAYLGLYHAAVLLLELGADITLKDKNSKTAHDVAVENKWHYIADEIEKYTTR